MEKLGVEPALLLAQIVNFGIIVVVLGKLLYRPILSMLAKRKKEIEEGLAAAERQKQEEEKLGVRREKLLTEARKEAREILEEGKKQAEEARREIVAAAHTEAADIVAKAKRDAAATHEALEGAIRHEAVDLAVAMAKRLVAGTLSVQDQHKLIAKNLREMEKAL